MWAYRLLGIAGRIRAAKAEDPLKRTLRIVGILLMLMGAVWFLQGINVLPGSFMTGQIEWAVYGGLAVVLGAGLLFLANRRRSDPPAN